MYKRKEKRDLCIQSIDLYFFFLFKKRYGDVN